MQGGTLHPYINIPDDVDESSLSPQVRGEG